MNQTGAGFGSEGGAGLPVSGEPAFLVIGKLTRPHGVHGEILMQVLTDFPDRLKPGMRLYSGEGHLPQVVRSIRLHSAGRIIAFKGFDDPESVGQLRNQFVYVPVDGLPDLPEGDFYHHQLIGLKVKTTHNRDLGTVAEILQTGANDVLVIKTGAGSEILIPYIEEIVTGIDLESGEILVDPIPGLLPD